MASSLKYLNRITGPPGTGKTSTLAKYARAAVEKYGSDAVIIASFTRAAAAEAAGRDLPLARGQIGTLHHFARQALDGPPLTADKLDQWNARQVERNYPQWQLSREQRDLDDPGFELQQETEGDLLLQSLENLRARLIGREAFPDVAAFEREWTSWKRELGLLDFTDLIEQAYEAVETAPGAPRVGLLDEAQDATACELRLWQKWSERMTTSFIVGDSDQTIYSFRGATPEAFLDPPLPPSQRQVLSQSYRVPRQVHALATKWIRQVRVREEAPYKPRDFEGEVRFAEHLSFRRDPEGLLADAQTYLSQGKTVLFLATCGYMLDELRQFLLSEGRPFHNPLRRKRQDWNPLHPSHGVPTKERLLAFLRHEDWRIEDLKLWTELVRSEGVLVRGAKKALGGSSGGVPSQEFLESLFESQALDHALRRDLDWLEANALASKQSALRFPLRVVRRYGIPTLQATPQILLGTIHSYKGGESQCVYLCPDLSVAGYEEWDAGGEGRDAIVRQLYVAFTRAAESLIICGPSSNLAVEIG